MRGWDSGERAALLINECQRGIVEEGIAGLGGLAEQVRLRGVIEQVASLARAFREAGLPVVHSTIVTRPDGVGLEPTCLLTGALRKHGAVHEGTVGAAICPALAPEPGDVVIQRMHGLTPFHATELEPVLRSLGVQTLVLAGVSTNIAVPGACIEAVNRGFSVVVPEDAVAGAWPEAHEFQIRHTLPLLASVTTVDEVMAQLKRSTT